MEKRCFISIELPENVKKEIKKIRDSLPEFIGKNTEVQNLHLTLKFLGEIDNDKIEKVREKIRKIDFKKINCEIDEIGFFSPKFIKIIWIHLSGAEELQKSIDNSLLDLFEKEERFMSHITIARIKSVKNKKIFLEELKKIKFNKIDFPADRFYLMESELRKEGPEYKIIEFFGEKYN